MLEIRPATTDDELAHIARIAAIVWPASPMSVEEMRWQERTYPGGRRFIAWLDGTPVGAGGAGRAYSFPPDFPGFWSNLSVLPAHRGGASAVPSLRPSPAWRGMPARRCSSARTTSDRTDSIDFLEHRGFREHERMKVVKLDLAGLEPPADRAAAGRDDQLARSPPGARPGRLRRREGGAAGHPGRRSRASRRRSRSSGSATSTDRSSRRAASSSPSTTRPAASPATPT